MGTTKVKVIDLSSGEKEVKASRKGAANVAAKLKEGKDEKDLIAKKAPKPEEVTTTQEQSAADETTAPTAPIAKRSKSQKPKKHARGAKYIKVKELVEADKIYTARESFVLLAKTSLTKFDPTVELHLNVTQKNIRGAVAYPHAVGVKKEKKYLVFASKQLPPEIKNVIGGDEKTIDDVFDGRLKPGRDFNAVIASPKFMPLLTKIARILGPAGMMPNPKNGTITENPQSVIESTSSDSHEFRSDPTAPIIHTKIGKLSLGEEKLGENLKVLIAAIGTAKVKKAVIKTTMSPAVRLDVTSL